MLTAGENKHIVQHALKQAEAAITLRYGPMSRLQLQQAMERALLRTISFQHQQK